MTRDVKKYKEGFFRYIKSRQKQRENTGLLLIMKDELVTNSAQKAEILDTFFTRTLEPQALESKNPG